MPSLSFASGRVTAERAEPAMALYRYDWHLGHLIPISPPPAAVGHDWKALWSKATAGERKDIVSALFGEVRDKAIVSATLADQQYAPLIASSEARRLRLVTPPDDTDEQVGLAPPDGLKPPTATQRPRLLPRGRLRRLPYLGSRPAPSPGLVMA